MFFLTDSISHWNHKSDLITVIFIHKLKNFYIMLIIYSKSLMYLFYFGFASPNNSFIFFESPQGSPQLPFKSPQIFSIILLMPNNSEMLRLFSKTFFVDFLKTKGAKNINNCYFYNVLTLKSCRIIQFWMLMSLIMV